MTNDAASLDQLHDILVPASVPWWPPAPGWYVVLGIVLVLMVILLIRALRHRLRNAYRHEALAALRMSRLSAVELATLLKRVALTAYPREQVASLTGQAWLDWLAQTSGLPIPSGVADTLTSGVYSTVNTRDTDALSEFVARWIRCHFEQDHRASTLDPRAMPC